MHVETEIGFVITRQASLAMSGARDETSLVKTEKETLASSPLVKAGFLIPPLKPP